MSEADKINEIHRLVVQIDDRVKDLRAAVFGNGQPGLKDRTTILEQAIITVTKAHAECPAREMFTGAAKRQSFGNIVALGALGVAAISLFLAMR